MSRYRRFDGNGPYSDYHYKLHDDLTVIDIDWVEYCRYCRKPLALIETARDIGQDTKSADVLSRVGDLAGLPVWVALYRDTPNGIQAFRVRMVSPKQTMWRAITAKQWFDILCELRTCHPMRLDVG